MRPPPLPPPPLPPPPLPAGPPPLPPASAKRARTIAVLGSGSDVGKSILVAGFGRILRDAGTRVVPFKAQNMANNSMPALARNGSWGEIGTAQVVQARACREPPRVEMNPILLKSGGTVDGVARVQVVLHGRVVANEPWTAYQLRHPQLLPEVLTAHRELSEATGAEVVLAEGAGSCVELNLQDHDLVNLPLVRALGCRWLLVCDIDRGGVFAQAVGVRACVTESDWATCAGVVVNKLRGDPAMFEGGRRLLEELVGRPVFVVPFLPDLGLEDEDGVALEHRLAADHPALPGRHTVVVVGYPHAAQASDITALERDPALDVRWCAKPPPAGLRVDAVVLPGSKLTRADLGWLEWTGFAAWIVEKATQGFPVLGICGGYQMLGDRIEDPDGIEGDPGGSDGLGILPVVTTLTAEKRVHPRQARFVQANATDATSEVVDGYEIHCGETSRSAGTPLLCSEDNGWMDGCRAGAVCGSYLHGVLDTSAARRRLLGAGSDPRHGDPIDRLARHLESAGLTAAVLLGCR